MLCDHQDRGLQPVVLTLDVPDDADAEGMRAPWSTRASIYCRGRGIGTHRQGAPARGLTPTDADRAWHQLAITACTAHGVRLLGYFLASADGIAAMPVSTTAAS